MCRDIHIFSSRSHNAAPLAQGKESMLCFLIQSPCVSSPNQGIEFSLRCKAVVKVYNRYTKKVLFKSGVKNAVQQHIYAKCLL